MDNADNTLMPTLLHSTPHPKPTPTPKTTPHNTPDTTNTPDNTSTLHDAGTWLIHHPIAIPILLIAALIGINIGWMKLRQWRLSKGQPTRGLGAILRDQIRFGLREDKRPIHAKTPWATGTRLYLALALTTTVLTILGHPLLVAAATATLLLTFTSRYNKIARARYSIVRQMFDVANGEIRYAKGAELNPWAYINVTSWNNLIQPGQTIVNITAAYQSEDLKTRERFERNFNGTVSEENAWTYKWESAKNRIICEPAAFLPSMAPYPGPGDKWDEIPIGVKGDGSQAVIPLSMTPHTLVCGPTGSGKASCLTTLTPTTRGWKRLGEIEVGDYLFGLDGRPTRVVDLSEIRTPEVAYEVEFSDGSVIKVDANHLWWTETRSVRESRWTESRKEQKRRALVSSDHVALLRAEAERAAEHEEITLPEAAALAGVNPTSPWVRDVAKSLGHTSEVSIQVAHHYADQIVTQEQTITRYNAREAFTALGQFEPNVPAWFLLRDDCAKRAQHARPGEGVTAHEVADFLGTTTKIVDAVLRRNAVPREKRPGHGKTLFWDAAAAWQAFADTRSPREVAWLDKREWFLLRAEQAAAEDSITSTELGAALDVTRSQALQTMKSLGVAGSKVREQVELAVVGKTVTKDTAPVPHYNKRHLLTALADQGGAFAWDQRHKQAQGAVRTTEEIRQTLRTSHGHANHSIPVAGPLVLPEADLPISPYTFGAWLGDGSSYRPEVCGIDHEVARNMEADGYTLRERLAPESSDHPDFRIWTVEGIRPALKSLGVLKRHTSEGRTKRIPALYLRASIEQRRALLAGLLDTDGTVGDTGSCEITQVSRDLAYDIRELAVSLGYRATIREGRAVFEGVDYGPAWTVAWTCDPEAGSPFRISRKVAAHRERSRFHAERNAYRYIVNVRRVEPVPMRCVMVDSPDRLFLIGETMIPTHNSVLQRSVLFHVLAHDETWRVVAIDMKKVEMAWLKKYPSVLKVATDLDEAVEVLRSLRAEMMRRYEEMEMAGVNHAKDLPDPPKAILCMIDESTVLLAPEGIKSEEGKERDALHAEAGMIIGELGRLSRASMIHVMACFQRPDAAFLKGETKANFDARIAAGRMDTTPSLMVLDSEAANRLPKIKGRGMVRIGGELDTFQGYFAEQAWFDDWLAAQQGGGPDGSAGGPGSPVVPGVVVDESPGAGPEVGTADGVPEQGGRKRRGGGLKALAAKAAAKAEARAARLDAEADAVEGSSRMDAGVPVDGPGGDMNLAVPPVSGVDEVPSVDLDDYLAPPEFDDADFDDDDFDEEVDGTGVEVGFDEEMPPAPVVPERPVVPQPVVKPVATYQPGAPLPDWLQPPVDVEPEQEPEAVEPAPSVEQPSVTPPGAGGGLPVRPPAGLPTRPPTAP